MVSFIFFSMKASARQAEIAVVISPDLLFMTMFGMILHPVDVFVTFLASWHRTDKRLVRGHVFLGVQHHSGIIANVQIQSNNGS